MLLFETTFKGVDVSILIYAKILLHLIMNFWNRLPSSMLLVHMKAETLFHT
jgi:hypothetical protein